MRFDGADFGGKLEEVVKTDEEDLFCVFGRGAASKNTFSSNSRTTVDMEYCVTNDLSSTPFSCPLTKICFLDTISIIAVYEAFQWRFAQLMVMNLSHQVIRLITYPAPLRLCRSLSL